MSFATTATRLTARFGRDFTLRRVTPGTYDPATGQTTPETVTNTTVKAIRLRPGITQLAGALIERKRAGLFIPATQPNGSVVTRPDTDDRIVDGSDVYEMGEVEPIDVSGGEIAYVVELGRG